MTKKYETVEEFLARGGEIDRLPKGPEYTIYLQDYKKLKSSKILKGNYERKYKKTKRYSPTSKVQ